MKHRVCCLLFIPFLNVSGMGMNKRFLPVAPTDEGSCKADSTGKNKSDFSNNYYFSVFKPCRFTFYKSMSSRHRLLKTEADDGKGVDDEQVNKKLNEITNSIESEFQSYNGTTDENEINEKLAEIKKSVESELQSYNGTIDENQVNEKLAEIKKLIESEIQSYNGTIGNISYIEPELDRFVSNFDFFFPNSDLMKDINGHTCQIDESNTDLEIVKIQDRKVFLWPDSCVAHGDRCYSLDGDSIKYALANSTIFANTSYAMTIPQDASLVSVNCAADHESFEEFEDDFPDVSSLIQWIVFTLIAIVFFVLAVLIGTIMCVCGGSCRCLGSICCGSKNRRHTSYQEIPTVVSTAVPSSASYPEPSAPYKTAIS